jgi:hydroxymethylbilane synthase
MRTLKIGTRKSALAQAQSRWVAEQIRKTNPGLKIELVLITTSGDKLHPTEPSPGRQTVWRSASTQKGEATTCKSPSPIWGEGAVTKGLKALFTKELEEALLDKRIDLAVHSLKDMAADLPEGLIIGAIPEREDHRDAWLSRNGTSFSRLPQGARVATGSIRRLAQLRHLRPDLELLPVRGNVDTRLQKLAGSNFDGIILAAAGLKRLGRISEVTEFISEQDILPAVGQGCLAIEVRENDSEPREIINAVDHKPSCAAASAERAFLKAMGGSCQTPIAALARVIGAQIILDGLVLAPSGEPYLREAKTGGIEDAEMIGRKLAEQLLVHGGDKILNMS